jgi:hypothetical protein
MLPKLKFLSVPVSAPKVRTGAATASVTAIMIWSTSKAAPLLASTVKVAALLMTLRTAASSATLPSNKSEPEEFTAPKVRTP